MLATYAASRHRQIVPCCMISSVSHDNVSRLVTDRSMCFATALDKAFENIDCMSAILRCQAKNRFYESTQRLIQPRRVLWRTVKFETRIRELVANFPDIAAMVEPLLVVRRTLREQFCVLHRRLLAIVRDDEVCRRLMTTPGVGPVVSLTYRATVDVPARFRKSKSVGAVFGLTCAKYQSGEVEW